MLQMERVDSEVEHCFHMTVWADRISVVEPKANIPSASISASYCGLTSLQTVLSSWMYHALLSPYQPVAGPRSVSGQGIKEGLLLYGTDGIAAGIEGGMRKRKQQGNGWFSCGYTVA